MPFPSPTVGARAAGCVLILGLMPSGLEAAEATSTSTSGSDDLSLEELRRAAEDLAQESSQAEPDVGSSGGAQATTSLGSMLNALNPEISASGDIAGLLVPKEPFLQGEDRSGFLFRELELDLRSSVDPFCSFRVQLSAGHEGVGLEEGYFQWSGLFSGVSLTFGRFRQALGTVNRWHLHAWDQFELPRALATMVGAEGLMQTGARAELLLGWFESVPITFDLEITNSENETLFAGPDFRAPSVLGNLSFHIPLGEPGYLEWGLSAVHGYHHRAVLSEGETEGVLLEAPEMTDLFSVDLNAAYDPPGGPDRFRLFFRTQGLYLSREEGPDRRHRFGAFAYLNAHLGRSWELGLRGDYLSDETSAPADALATARLGLAPYLAWWQSEFFRIRAQYSVQEPVSAEASELEHLLVLQLTGAIGPHRHERY